MDDIKWTDLRHRKLRRTGGNRREEAKVEEIQEWGDLWHFHGRCQLLGLRVGDDSV